MINICLDLNTKCDTKIPGSCLRISYTCLWKKVSSGAAGLLADVFTEAFNAD